MFLSFLSPIDEYSNLPFRIQCQKYGAEAVCVPLINATLISRDPKKIERIITNNKEKNLGVQLVGNVSEDIGLATKIISKEIEYVKWINLNCGCPSIRTMSSGGGSALLKNPKTILESINEMKKSDLLVSIKIRLDEKVENTLELLKKAEKSGVDFIIIHGRTAKMGYSGKSDWNSIKLASENVSIPIIGNGDLKNSAEGSIMVKQGFCKGFMIGRSAMSDPTVFGEYKVSKKELFLEYVKLYETYFEDLDHKDVKLKAINFVSAMHKATEIRNSICRTKNSQQILELINNLA